MIVYPYSFLRPPLSASTIDYISFSSDTVDRTTYTFTNINIGGPGLIAVMVHLGGSSPSISSATIGGLSATKAVEQVGSFLTTAIIYSRITAVGSTATISITLTGGESACAIGVYRIQNNISDTPFQTQSAVSNTLVASITLPFTSLPNNGIGIAGNTGYDNSDTTWTNATEQYDTQVVTNFRVAAANFKTTASGNRTITESFSPNNRFSTVGAVWL